MTLGGREPSARTGSDRGTLPRRAWKVFVRRVVVLERSLAEVPEPERPRTESEIRCTWLAPDDLQALLRLRPEQEAAPVHRLWAQGHRCASLWLDEELVCSGWSAVGPSRAPVRFLGRSLMLPPGDGYFFDTYASPAVRRLGLSAFRSAWARRRLAKEGVCRVLALVATDNVSSLKLCEGLGYRKMGVYSSLGFLEWRWFWSSSAGGGQLPRLEPTEA